ncbi:MAG: hypothetical protein WC466_06350 [Candidatus Izemoplasmatales bacterium]
MNSAVIIVNYEQEKEFKFKYKSITLSFSKNKKNFCVGNFIKDWFDCMKFVIQKQMSPICFSSSVDHFVSDSKLFDSAYLHLENNNKPTLMYIDKTDPSWIENQKHIFENHIEFFVNKNTKPTWDQLKIYCK